MADNSNLQSNQATNAVPVSTLKEILTIEEAAEFLSVSKSYLYKQTSAQAIPHYKPTGKRCYFKRSELEAWILAGRISTKSEIAQRANAYCLKTRKCCAAKLSLSMRNCLLQSTDFRQRCRGLSVRCRRSVRLP